MTTGPSLIGNRPIFEKSNTELISSLRKSFLNAKAITINHTKSNNISNGDPTSTSAAPTSTPIPQSWTSTSSQTLHIPSPLFSTAPLSEERSSYDITLKLFFLPGANADATSRTAHAHEALHQVLSALKISSVDLLIVSFPGISFDADDDDSDDSDDNNNNNDNNDTNTNADAALKPPSIPPLTRTLTSENRLTDSLTQTWHGIESLHTSGLVSTLGVAEFGSDRLERFLPLTKIRPGVNQINVRDCCVVPKGLILYAREQGIQLLTHNDCTDILPRGTVREILEGVFHGDDRGEGGGEGRGRRGGQRGLG